MPTSAHGRHDEFGEFFVICHLSRVWSDDHVKVALAEDSLCVRLASHELHLGA